MCNNVQIAIESKRAIGCPHLVTASYNDHFCNSNEKVTLNPILIFMICRSVKPNCLQTCCDWLMISLLLRRAILEESTKCFTYCTRSKTGKIHTPKPCHKLEQTHLGLVIGSMKNGFGQILGDSGEWVGEGAGMLQSMGGHVV